ncbi:MAG TPA: hypothetical protein VIG99_27400 [Myxococcaceae bacterium]|jgi:hypothetical protein
MTTPVRLAFALGTLALAAGCDPIDRVNRPLPQHFSLQGLTGRVERESLSGRPWVVELWVPD